MLLLIVNSSLIGTQIRILLLQINQSARILMNDRVYKFSEETNSQKYD